MSTIPYHTAPHHTIRDSRAARHRYRYSKRRKTNSITPPILPPRPPPLLPKPTIKLRLPQLPINLIMRLTHPPSKLLPPAKLGLVIPTRVRHPALEIIRAYPARIQSGEKFQEPAHILLLLCVCFLWVCCCH